MFTIDIYIYKYIWYIYMVYIQIYIRVLGKGISDVFVEANIIFLFYNIILQDWMYLDLFPIYSKENIRKISID